MLKTLTVTLFAAALSVGATGLASAAPSARAVAASRVAAPALLQNVHWEWRHHHRVWVPDHHRRYHRY